MTAAPVLELEGLYAGYSGSAVVRGLDLRVHEGEVVALLGANGAGKTTTLLTISGLLAPIAGTVVVLGEVVKPRDRPHDVARRGLAHVPEDRCLFFQQSVLDNLRLGVRKGRFDLAGALDTFPALKPLLKRKAGLLSGGEQQMLALARALVSKPRLLMVDEMSLGLAPVIVESLLPVLRAIAVETGVGVLLVEQHVHMVLKVADRACVLRHGTVMIEGPCSELADRQDLLEASYLGDAAL